MDMLARNRKYKLAVFFAVSSTALAAFGKLTGVEYVAAITFILGLYSKYNVDDKKDES